MVWLHSRKGEGHRATWPEHLGRMCDEELPGETDKEWSDAALAVEVPHVMGALMFSNEKWQEGIECVTSPKPSGDKGFTIRARI